MYERMGCKISRIPRSAPLFEQMPKNWPPTSKEVQQLQLEKTEVLVFYSQMDGTLVFLTSSSQGLLSDLLHQQIKEEARSVVYATV
jgi:hypothetical protein